MNSNNKRGWLDANQICMAKGNSVALNLMFETKQDHKLFLALWDKYLGNMTEVINYHLTPTGWAALFKTKSEEDIKLAYLDQRKKSKKANRQHTLTKVSRILSEHFRIFLSQYVRKLNASHGRRGTLVMERFHKYVIKKEIDYQKIFSLLTGQVYKNPQKVKKFQANESEYDVKKEITENSTWVSGNAILKGIEDVSTVLKCMINRCSYTSVLRKFYPPMKKYQTPPKSP